MPRPRRARRRATFPKIVQAIDALEPRRLLTSFADADGNLTVTGTDGNDTIVLNVRSGQLQVFLNGDPDGSFDNSAVTSVSVSGVDGDDQITIESGVIGSRVNGNTGNDTLIGGEGDDTLDGDEGNDTVDGKVGADALIGGPGFDAADYRFETQDLRLSIDGDNNERGGGAEGDNIALSIERIVGGSGNDRIEGSDADNSLSGRDGDDTITGLGGNDSLDGNNGDDLLNGGEGDDVLTGDAGNDTMNGDNGDDAFIANDGQADTLDGGNGNDTATADQPGDTFSSIEGGVNLPAPEVQVVVNGNNVTDNFTTVPFGSATQGQGGGPARVFTVSNTGDDVLSLGQVNVPAGFILIDGLPSSLNPGQSDTFTVQLDTSVAGDKAGDVNFSNSDADENPFNFTVTGTVNPPVPQFPEVTVGVNGNNVPDNQNAPIVFGPTNQGATPPSVTFTVTNDGDATLNLSGLSAPEGFSIVEGLSGSLNPGQSDTFTVRLDTGTVGTFAGDITFNNNDPNEDPFNFAVSGTVRQVQPPQSPEITVVLAGQPGGLISGQSLVEFGNVAAGSRGPTRTFTVRNDGNAALNLGAISVPAGFAVIDPLVASLAPGESDVFIVRLDTATAGNKSGNISFNTNDPDDNEDPFAIRVNGDVTPASQPEPEIAANLLQKGKVRGAVVSGVSNFEFAEGWLNQRKRRPARAFRITNLGNATLNLSNLSVPAGFLVADGLPATLAPGKSDTLVVVLDTKRLGQRSGDITFSTDDPDDNENPFRITITGNVLQFPPGTAPEVSVNLVQGKRVRAAVLMNQDNAISFGSAPKGGKAPTRTFRIANTGNAPLSIGGVSVPSGFALLTKVTRSLAPGKSQSFIVRMNTDTTGTKSGEIRFTTNDPNERSFAFPIAGQVAGAPVAAPTVTASLSGGTLTVNGTNAIDTITFSVSKGRLNVVGNDRAVGGSPFAGVRRIVVNAFGGDDRIVVGSVGIPVTLLGGDGNDTLVGGAGADVIKGGAGNDNITGGAGLDQLLGEDGNDVLNSQDGLSDRVVDGGNGTDTAHKDRTDPGTNL
jgi:hypothetical protein